MSKKSAVKTKPEKPSPEQPITELPPAPETPPEPVQSTSDAQTTTSASSTPSTPTPTPTPTPPLTLKYLHQELESLKKLVAELQETIARKRKPIASNGKVQIKDKQTGIIYKSKNNAYQTLLKSGELRALVDKGILGPIPAKNTFGWYTLAREWPDRFEEVQNAQITQ
jgi:hypothetical protein